MRLRIGLGGVRAAGLLTVGIGFIAYLYRPQGPHGESATSTGALTSKRRVHVSQLRPSTMTEPSAEPIRTIDQVIKDNDDFYARETAGGHGPTAPSLSPLHVFP